MNNSNNKIIGYNPQTGQPIYETQQYQQPIQQQVMLNNQINNNMPQNNIQPMQQQYVNNQYQQYPINNNKNNSKKNIIFGVIGLIVVSLIIGLIMLLGSNNKSVSRTVMIYMVGSNLESQSGLGTVDLNSIDYNKIYNEDINVVLIAGGTEKWDNNYIDESETSIYELTQNGYKKVKTQNIQNMGDANVFSNYLNYVYENYKTDEYDLVFWNHGGAIDGSEYDDLSNDNLSLFDMRQGLDNSPFSKEKLEVVIFRTCLNGTIEVADVFKDYSDYLVASEEITLGSSIASVLNFVNDVKRTDEGVDVGTKFINSYKNQIATLKNYYGTSEYIYSTYSVIDLSQIKELVNSLNEFVSDINVNENYNEIARVRSNLYQYAYMQADDPSYDMVDLYNLVEGLKKISPNKGEKVLKQLESTIKYNWATNSNSRGISIYFPYNGSNTVKNLFLDVYSDFSSFDGYKKFITSFNTLQSNGTKKHSFTENKITLSTTEKESDFSLELTEEQLKDYARAEYLVFMDKGDGYYYPVYKGKGVTLNGNTLNANINNAAFKIVDENDDEFLLTLFETYNDVDYIKYITYGVATDLSSNEIYEWKTDSVEISFILDKKTKKITIGSVLKNEQGDLSNTVAVDLDDYQYISFAASSRKLLDEKGNVDMNLYLNSSNGIQEGVEVSIEEFNNFKLADFEDGNDYYCVFRIYDTNNNYSHSKLIKMN